MNSVAMIRVTGEDRTGAIKLFEQHDAGELMRPCHLSEGELVIGAPIKALCKSIGAANDEANCWAIFGAPLAQQ